MKVFSVSKACTACGECVLRTALLMEDKSGHAVPTPGKHIRESDLPDAQRVAAQCPVSALSIVEEKSVASEGKDGLKELVQVLEQKLTAVEIPEEFCSSDIAFRAKDYSVNYGYISDERRFIYSSERAAESAGKSQFEHVFWNRRPDFVTDILTQYKSRVLRKYFDLSDPDRTYYAEIGQKIEAILKQILAEASSMVGKAIPLPDTFVTFHPELEDSWFKKQTKEEYTMWLVMSSYVKTFCEGFERMEYHRKRDYEQYIIADWEERTEYDSRGREKTNLIYCFEGANESGKDMVKDVIDYLGIADPCGVRCIDEYAADKLNYIMGKYRKLVNQEISKKVDEFKRAIERV